MAKRKFNPDDFIIRFGEKLRSLRKKRGWTLEETESRGWKSWQHLQRIETGKNINLKTLLELAELYDTTPEDLLKDV